MTSPHYKLYVPIILMYWIKAKIRNMKRKMSPRNMTKRGQETTLEYCDDMYRQIKSMALHHKTRHLS
jgi:hypothetical protein